MNRALSEVQVLKKLNIEDFRHLTKDKVMTMVTMLDRMDPEVDKKSIRTISRVCRHHETYAIRI